MSASGFPGRRVEARREGMRMMGVDTAFSFQPSAISSNATDQRGPHALHLLQSSGERFVSCAIDKFEMAREEGKIFERARRAHCGVKEASEISIARPHATLGDVGRNR